MISNTLFLSFPVIITSFSKSSSVKDSIFFPNLFSRHSMNFALKISSLDLIFSQMILERNFSRSPWIRAGFPFSVQQAVAILSRL